MDESEIRPFIGYIKIPLLKEISLLIYMHKTVLRPHGTSTANEYIKIPLLKIIIPFWIGRGQGPKHERTVSDGLV